MLLCVHVCGDACVRVSAVARRGAARATRRAPHLYEVVGQADERRQREGRREERHVAELNRHLQVVVEACGATPRHATPRTGRQAQSGSGTAAPSARRSLPTASQPARTMKGERGMQQGGRKASAACSK